MPELNYIRGRNRLIYINQAICCTTVRQTGAKIHK